MEVSYHVARTAGKRIARKRKPFASKEINNDLFAFKLNYNEVENALNYTGKALYNGNISETYWRTSSDNVKRKYGYFYDNLNRLKNAVYQKPNLAVPVTNSYNESLMYDKNGNITSLFRNGEYDDAGYALEIDRLGYNYDSAKPNQLTKVIDESTNPNGFKDSATNSVEDYLYDDFGNMLRDQNKGITNISYNHLNLPLKIVFGETKYIQYLYNATGQKISKTVTDGSIVTITEYLDGYQYIKPNNEPYKLHFFPHAEGYVNTIGGNNYVFNYTDHLGNIRLSYGKDPSIGVLTILEENNYYPFGLKHDNYNITKQEYDKYGEDVGLVPCVNCAYKYKYNGKEYQDELGLNFYDYGARNYDPAIGRWMNVDPLTEKMTTVSPYNYCYNNPVTTVDYGGLYPIYVVTRSYAPFKTFGPGNSWHGDNRGATLNRNANHRTWVGITHDTETRKTSATGKGTWSSKVDGSKTGYSKTNVENRSEGSKIDIHSYGNNGAQIFSSDIDQYTKLDVKIEGNVKENHILSVSGTISGDDFPNQESFMYDSKGNSVWLGNFETTGDRQSG